MSEPYHFAEAAVCGRVERLVRAPSGQVIGVLLRVNTAEEIMHIAVVGRELPKVAKETKIFVKGRLAAERFAGVSLPALCLVARHFDVLKAPRGAVHVNDGGVSR